METIYISIVEEVYQFIVNIAAKHLPAHFAELIVALALHDQFTVCQQVPRFLVCRKIIFDCHCHIRFLVFGKQGVQTRRVFIQRIKQFIDFFDVEFIYALYAQFV